MLFKHETELLAGRPRPFLSHLQLRPHGERLLTSGAAFWLFAARVLVFAMAGAEALAWGYLGYLFGDGREKWAVAAFTGLVIFLVVWMIDVSLLTLDRASDEHEKQIFKRSTTSGKGTHRTVIAVATRIILVVGSLTITAPYLSQLVFHKEIEQWIQAEATRRIDQARTDLRAKHDKVLASKDLEIEEKRNKLEAEVAGAGASGRYGKGPASEAILDSIERLETERVQMAKKKEEELAEFESEVANWDMNRENIATVYNVVLPQLSILSNREALLALRSKPEHQQTELAIKAFLGFIFIGLLLLKLFEPRSTRFYLSEVLQQEYSRYLARSFDELLPDTEKASVNPEAMTPQRLYDFLVNVWAPVWANEVQESEARIKKAALREDIATLEKMLERTRPMVVAARSAVERDRERCDQQMDSYQKLLSAIALVQGHVTDFGRQQEALDTGDSPLDARGVAEYGTHVRSQLSEAKLKLRELQLAKSHEQEKLERTRRAVAEAERALRDRNEELRRIEEKIYEARSMTLSHDLRPSPVRT